ncbi:MAG: glycosyltransferase, partial [bacterium]
MMLRPHGFHFYDGEEKWLARGVTYGPFRPREDEECYPPADQQRQDFKAISEMGANVVRLYSVPDESLAALASEYGLRLVVDIPWPKHLDVYSDSGLQKMCRDMVTQGVTRLSRWSNVAGVFVGNEIPGDIARWAGPRKVERFLQTLYEEAKAISPDLPVGFCNFPSTEYLRLEFLDFLGFNVYLHDDAALRDYLVRLRHLYPEKPLFLSEFGIDTQRHSEDEQARLLEMGISTAYEVGMAGVFVFSWTDEWHAGGYDIEDWSFGIVNADRTPKRACEAVSRVFGVAPQSNLLEEVPRVSVVVATYNGGRTLRNCLLSLGRLCYPNFEIVVVDDGSTDNTWEILSDFKDVRVITQPNRGLSAARNAGISAATGEIVAFTDSDCVADPDWLYHLVATMRRESAAGVGGPNLTPAENRLVAKCIALAPGHATHVLLSPTEAEHVPGCNMAFRRDALLEVGGFDPVFTKAGDDVDIIWRLQELGRRVVFSTGGFVWHHRRPTLRAYWKQQKGYGEAQALLLRRHPHRFNEQGQSIWRGTIYPSYGNRPLFTSRNVHFGVFASAGYQCLYAGRESALPYIVTSLEWWLFFSCLVVAGFFTPAGFEIGVGGVGIALAVSALQAYQKWSSAYHLSFAAFPVVWLTWLTQPIVRGTARYLGRLRT